MEDTFSPEVLNLINELNLSKTEVEKYIIEVEGIKGNVAKIFPDKLDYRNQRVLDEKAKIFSEFFNTLLKLRQEKHKLILDEIRIRTDRKIKGEEDKFDIRELLKEMKKEEVKNE